MRIETPLKLNNILFQKYFFKLLMLQRFLLCILDLKEFLFLESILRVNKQLQLISHILSGKKKRIT